MLFCCLLPLRFCPFWVSHGMILQVRFEVNVPRTFSDGLKNPQLTGDSPRVVSWGGGILKAFGGKMSPAFFETGGFVFQRYFFRSKMGHFGHLNRWVLFKWCHSSGRLGGFKSFFPFSQRNDPIRILFFKWVAPSPNFRSTSHRRPWTLDPAHPAAENRGGEWREMRKQFNGEDMNDMNKKTHWVVATQKVSEFSSRIPLVSWSKFDGSHIFQRGWNSTTNVR